MDFETLVKKLSPIIKRITYKLNGHFTSFNHDDLYQEALMRLWSDYNEGKLADKTDSYILQGCFFHLKNYIRQNYNKAFMVSLEQGPEDKEEGGLTEILSLKGADSCFEEVHCNIVVEQIMNNGLTPREKEVFMLALEGLTVREIGDRLDISHVRVVKLRANIKEKCKKHLDTHLF
jgi:RNA polymerase sigma factor (sigma-70 family)